MKTSEQTADALVAPNLAVSTVIFTLRTAESGELRLAIALVKRIRDPFEGLWALPGGPLKPSEALGSAASRNLRETTGLKPRYLEQLYAFGGLDRGPGITPEDRMISIVYWALVGTEEAELALANENVGWFWLDSLPELAFDHSLIVEYALWRLRNKLEYSRLALGFLGETFTLARLREVYAAVLGRELDPGNFRRMVEADAAIVPTGEKLAGTKHRPPQLYRYDTSIGLTDLGPLSRTPQLTPLAAGDTK